VFQKPFQRRAIALVPSFSHPLTHR
jgi:hypothetical protein